MPTDIDKDVDDKIYKKFDMEIETIHENHANIVSEDHDSFDKNKLGIRFVGDNVNVNVRTSPRYMGKGRETKQNDLFNIIAVENRVPFEESADGKSIIQQIPAGKQLCNFVPDRNDNCALREDFKHLIGNTLKKYVPAFEWLAEHIPNHREHPNVKYTSTKSKKVHAFKY